MSRDEDVPAVRVEWLELGPPEPQDGPAGPARMPPGRWVLAAVVVLSVLTALAVSQRSHPSARARPARPSGAPSARPSASAGPVTSAVPPPSPPAPLVRVTQLGHPLLGVRAGWELFARGPTVVVRVQPVLGRVTTTVVPALDSSGPVTFLAGSAEAVVRPLDAVAGYAVPDGRAARQLVGPLAQGGTVVPGPDPDHVWVPGLAHGAPAMLLVDLDGRASSAVGVPVGSLPYGVVPDGSGYPAFSDTGGVYDARPTGVHRITSGALLAAGPTRWLTAECYDQDRCSTVVIDQVTTRRTVLRRVDPPDQPGLVSPDGRTAALYTRAPTPALHLLDLASGAERRTALRLDPSSFATGSLVWSPDSRWLFVVGTSDGRLYAVNPTTAAASVVDAGLPPLSQVAVRSAR